MVTIVPIGRHGAEVYTRKNQPQEISKNKNTHKKGLEIK